VGEEEELARELGCLNQGKGCMSSSVGVRDWILLGGRVEIESLRLGMLAEGSNETSGGELASGGETGEGNIAGEVTV